VSRVTLARRVFRSNEPNTGREHDPTHQTTFTRFSLFDPLQWIKTSMFFDYELPPQLIAQYPSERRDESRLMVIDRQRGEIVHRRFADLPDYLEPDDLLVLNDTRVLPARLIGTRQKTGGRWEGLFVRVRTDGLWEMLTQTRGHPENGEVIEMGSGQLQLVLRGKEQRFTLVEPLSDLPFAEVLNRYGHIPLPPYIRKGQDEATDHERYQTIFARESGSIAAPTAGLHFTPELFERLKQKNCRQTYVTLHVGLGTFEPIRTEDPTKHEIHTEWCEVSTAVAEQIERAKQASKRVIAVGTTTTRTLESAQQAGRLQTGRRETGLFIHPPYQFQVIDALITNFHLPKSTLLLLVGALMGEELLRRAYSLAIENEYRFFSYGDAMLIV
jgi:S-adenosylmethionine:tRNA ribosyltransferase-isomerase